MFRYLLSSSKMSFCKIIESAVHVENKAVVAVLANIMAAVNVLFGKKQYLHYHCHH